MFDVDILNSCYGKFSHELMELFDENKSCIDCLLYHEYTFSGRNWNTGETWSVPLSESIRYNERIKINQLKEKILPVPA